MCAALNAVWLLLYALAAMFAVDLAQAQEWCRGTPNLTEELICLNPELGDLDARLTRAFAAATRIEDDKVQLTSQQRQWVKRRNACEDDYDCILISYQSRIKALERIAKRAPPNGPLEFSGNVADPEVVALPATVVIPQPRPMPQIAFNVPDADPLCDFATTQSQSCATYAAGTMKRYYEYLRQSIETSPNGDTSKSKMAQNIELCEQDSWCLWRKYSRSSEVLYNIAQYRKLPIVEPPKQVRLAPSYAAVEFTCEEFVRKSSAEFRIRLTPWIDDNGNRVLAMNDYGRWNIILVDENDKDTVNNNDSIMFWWQVRLIEDKSFLEKIWRDSKKMRGSSSDTCPGPARLNRSTLSETPAVAVRSSLMRSSRCGSLEWLLRKQSTIFINR
ncbi:lysozyme inhibitor LprI family protein [Mesorhizobium sp. B2-3-4]|uniref:lysozyme inhibitor LprI family protein n=1 Tax=Mesorhizobium sp. B2-3-4 TaxID=2589959 RepID=UPI001127269D|nr:lysozyme inhibitor LprI family protein [Mesorhizobium sp. B2-3-4]TPM41714.1 hypothetical protein FJ967_01935 [Mesorhizobium sp. B2-3-4]